MRNLDITTLRSFVAVADSGGVTRAAGFLHLTQSAVSMQLKRLEELLGVQLLDRSGRTIALTAEGDQLLGYARRMVALNDELIGRLTDQAFEGEVTLGVPHDIVYPAIPRVLQQMNAAFPRVQVNLCASHTRTLLDQFGQGKFDVILTTEGAPGPGGETLSTRALCWVGAPGGSAWRHRPLNLALGRNCRFRPVALQALDAAGIDWTMTVDTESDRTIEAAVAADLAVHTMIDGAQSEYLEVIDHGGALPELPEQNINLYAAKQDRGQVIGELVDLLRCAFRSRAAPRLRTAS